VERRTQVLERKREEYWNCVQQYYDSRKDEAHQDTFRQVSWWNSSVFNSVYKGFECVVHVFIQPFRFCVLILDTYRHSKDVSTNSAVSTNCSSRNV
jgi:hypothetical protein